MNKIIKAQIEAYENHLIESANLVLGLIDKEHIPYMPDTRVRKYSKAVRNDLQRQIQNLRKNLSITKDELIAAEYDISKLEKAMDDFQDIMDNFNEILNCQADRISDNAEKLGSLGAKVSTLEAQNLAMADYSKQLNSKTNKLTTVAVLQATALIIVYFSML